MREDDSHLHRSHSQLSIASLLREDTAGSFLQTGHCVQFRNHDAHLHFLCEPSLPLGFPLLTVWQCEHAGQDSSEPPRVLPPMSSNSVAAVRSKPSHPSNHALSLNAPLVGRSSILP